MNKLKKIILLIGIIVSSIIMNGCTKEKAPLEYETLSDPRDGEKYEYIKIGNQYWMSENLRYKPASGNYWAYNNSEAELYIHGYLYEWETANDVCPVGWHLPSNAEWTELANTLGGFDVAGGKMKTPGTSIWNSPNTAATNSSGFCGVPSGLYLGYDEFEAKGNLVYYWSSEESLNIYWLSFQQASLGQSTVDLGIFSASVRCVKDN